MVSCIVLEVAMAVPLWHYTMAEWSAVLSDVAMAVPLWHYTMTEWSAVLSQQLPGLCLCDITQWQNGQLYCPRGCHGCAFVTLHSGRMVSCIVWGCHGCAFVTLHNGKMVSCIVWGCHGCAFVTLHSGWIVSCIVPGVVMVVHLRHYTMAEWSAVLSHGLPWLCLWEITQWQNGQLYGLRDCHGCVFKTLHNGRAEWSNVMSQGFPWLSLCDLTQWQNGQLYCLRGCHGCAFVT